MHKARALMLASFLLASPVDAAQYRWAIKTGTDPDARLVRSTKHATVSELCAIPRPDHIPSMKRLAPVEQTTYVVQGKLLVFRLESDGDYHVVIQDMSDESTMVTEIPDPNFVAGSPWEARMTAARAEFSAKYHPKSSRGNGDMRRVEITGVGFFDRRNEGEGGADNGIELHPVVAIRFLR